MSFSNLFIIIPVHNRRNYTQGCLASLTEQTYSRFSIVVVDDGSMDGTSEMISQQFPEVILLHGDGNLWWSRSINRGVDYALQKNADSIMTLNDDLIVDPECIKSLYIASKQFPDSILGCFAFALEPGIINPVQKGMRISWRMGKEFEVDFPENGYCESDILPGRGMLIPKCVFDKIGQFDWKKFPQGGADYDFALRARKAGFKAIAVKNAVVRCYNNATGSQKLKAKKSLINFLQYLISIRSSGNLPIRIKFAFRHCPWYYLPTYLFLDLGRVILSYWKSAKQ